MTTRQAFLSWLQGPRRSYGEGLALFRILADEEMQSRYLRFLEEPDDEECQDVHLNILVDKMSRISRTVRQNPDYKADVLEKHFEYIPKSLAATKEPAQPSVSFSRYDDAVDEASLPKEQRDWFEEIRSIMPMYQKLHAELSTVKTDDERKKIADELCSLDDRRRHLWDLLDSYSERKHLKVRHEPEAYSKSPLVSGLEMARRRKRLKDNIRTARMSISRYEKSAQKEAATNAKLRLDAYLLELDALEKQIADAESKE